MVVACHHRAPGGQVKTARTNQECQIPHPERSWLGVQREITCGINEMKLFWPTPCRDFRVGHRAASKATMCFEIKRYANYVPIPKQMRCTPYQGFGQPRITGHGLGVLEVHVWNKQDGAIPADTLSRFSGEPAGYEQSHDVS